MARGVLGRPAEGVLKLDRAAGGDNRGGEQCCDVADTGAEHARGGERAARAGHRRAASGGGSSATTDPERLREQSDRTERRHERRELPTDPAHPGPELATSGAVTQMTTGRGVRPHPAVVGGDELGADVRAGGLASLRGGREADPGAHEQRLDRRHRYAKRSSELGVAHAGELAHQQGRALLLGQTPDIGDEPPERLTPLGLGDRIVDRRPDELDQLRYRWRRAAELVDAAVVRHAVQPRAECEIAMVHPQTRVRPDEHVLERVFGILA